MDQTVNPLVISIIPTHYIARKEDFEKAITGDNVQLKVIAIKGDGTSAFTNFTNTIIEVHKIAGDMFNVHTFGSKRSVIVKLI